MRAKLTSLLHWRTDTAKITNKEVDAIYTDLFGNKGESKTPDSPVLDSIILEAQECLKCADGANFENKIVLSIAIRLLAEQYMVREISDPAFLAGITENQTNALFRRFKAQFPRETRKRKHCSASF